MPFDLCFIDRGTDIVRLTGSETPGLAFFWVLRVGNIPGVALWVKRNCRVEEM